MKKPSKPAASPAPATAKAAKPAVAAKPAAAQPAIAAKSAVASKPVQKTPPPAVKAAAPAPKAKPPAPAVDPVNPAPSAGTSSFTVIDAQVDVGFGNSLFVRGEGPGLSWSKGLPLKNEGSAHWTISLPRSARPIVFKLLINDETWSAGDDYRADPGVSMKISPSFES